MHSPRRNRLIAGTAAVGLVAGLIALSPGAATAAPAAPVAVTAALAPTTAAAPLTNLAHLDFLLDTATPPADVPGHTTYRLAEEPELVMPWTYADARDGGTFERVGGGPLDPETGYWGQGAYNADDITRAAVVYIRHWTLTGDESSRDSAYELLRATAYLQTTEGPNAGNVVLWMQPDGTLNPSAEPVELPDPSDSGESYWLARTIWALGEGYAAFHDEDPEFAAFLDERLSLSLDALDRQVLVRYGQWEQSDGLRVPGWLIADGADASAEAALGLAARVGVDGDARAATSLRQLSEGIAAMAPRSTKGWPYGAILPWAQSRSMWHAWGSQMPAALAAASVALDDPALAEPAIADAAVFTPTLLTAGGPDNGWFPTPTDRVQIAYGADSRVQSLLAVAEATGSRAFEDLAAIQAAWFFGANRAGEAMYVPETGVTYDGLQPDGTINRNSGAESTIHGLLAMIALDAHPELAARAAAGGTLSTDGLRVVEAEDATSTDGTIATPESWTGESSWSGDSLTLARGQKATFEIGTADGARWIEPVTWTTPGALASTIWTAGRAPVGILVGKGPAQGISPAPGVLLPRSLQLPVSGSRPTVTAKALVGSTTLDALIVRPQIARLMIEGDQRTELVQSSAPRRTAVTVGAAGWSGAVRVYDAEGALVGTRSLQGAVTVTIPAGGFAIALG